MSKQQDIIIAGVGGQGILTIAGLIGMAALDAGLHVKQSEVHGMAQRGGAVVSHLRLGAEPVASDLIPEGGAHLLLSMEPMEVLRYFPYARKDAAVVANRNPVKNIAAYPELETILARIQRWERHVIVDGEGLARKAGSVKTVNIVMLGAASGVLVLSVEEIRSQIEKFFARKGAEVVEQNLKAFEAGREAAGLLRP